MNAESTATRKYVVFISYRHADNKAMGRKWANWLHEALESYEVPPDLIGTTNQRGDKVPASLYPVFRDEEELPADADLSTNIRRALENSGLLVVLCSPRAVQSRFVADEIRYFKELGHSHRILALIIDGEPNASDDPAKRETLGSEAECFPEPLRFGVAAQDNPGHIDWTKRTEPIAADVRPSGRPEQGWTTAAAYQEQLEKQGGLARKQLTSLVSEYAERLELAKLKIIAGALGQPLGELTKRDKAYQLAKARHGAKVLRRWLAVVMALTAAAAFSAYLFWQQKQRAFKAEAATAAQFQETSRQLERAQLEEGRAWFERARLARNNGEHLTAIMFAARAVGFHGYGRQAEETPEFVRQFPHLLGKPMVTESIERERKEEKTGVAVFIHATQPSFLPLWCSGILDGVGRVAFSPDGSRIASGSLKGKITIWDAATGRDLVSFQGHSRVSSLAFSPDGTRLASCTGDRTIKVLDVVTGKPVASHKGHDEAKELVVFSPDGTLLACCSSTDTWITFFDAKTGNEFRSFRGHGGGVSGLAFSPDGSRLATGSRDKTIRVWDTTTGDERSSFKGYEVGDTLLAFSPDGRLLAAASSVGGEIALWDADTGNSLAQLTGPQLSLSAMVFSPDGKRLISGSFDQTIRIWDVAARQQLASLKTGDGIGSLALSPDATRLLTCAPGKNLRLWDLALGKELAHLVGHTSEVTSVVFSPDGTRLASGACDNTVRLWDATTGKELACLRGHTGTVNCVAFSLDGTRLASGSKDKTIKLWDATTGTELAQFQGTADFITRVAFSPDGMRLGSMSLDGSAGTWDIASGKELGSPEAADAAQARQWISNDRNPSLSADGRMMAVADQTQIFIVPVKRSAPDLIARLDADLLVLQARNLAIRGDGVSDRTRNVLTLLPWELQFPELKQPTPMLHVRQDTLAQLANPKLTPGRRAELRMELCTKSSQFRAATALWQRLLQGEWPGFEGATVPKDQAPATIPADSPIRRLYLLALIDATKHPQIHGHPAICQTAAQIAPVLTKEMMATPTISLAMMSLMQTLATDDSAEMRAPRAALMKRLEEVATKEWLDVLRESAGK